MAKRLSDDELRRALQDYGEDVGPITPTTRSTWEKKLGALRRSQGPLSKNSSTLNALSSDDSEIENSASSVTARKKRTYNVRGDIGERSERLSLIRPRETDSRPDSDIFKKPSAIHIPALSQEKRTHTYQRTQHLNRKNKKNPGRNSTFDMETSDSDFDSEGTHSKLPRLRRKPLTSNFFTYPSPTQGVTLRQTNDESLSSNIAVRRKSTNSTWNAKPQTSLPRFSTTFDRLKRESANSAFQSNGFLSSSVSNGDFGEEKGIQGSSTNYSHCVSWLLVLGAVAFFVIIGAVYMTEVQKTSQTSGKSYSKFCKGLEKELCKPFLFLLRELHQILTSHAGDFECETAKNRNLSVPEARAIMKNVFSSESGFEMEHFDFIFNRSVFLFNNNQQLGVRCHYLPGQEKSVSALEAVQGAKSFWCRVRLSLQWTATKLLLLMAFCLLLFVSYLGAIFWKKRREAQEKLFYEMVEKVIDILQDPLDPAEPLVGSCKAVVNVRDALIPAKKRKELLWMWDRVVAFIEENESRVSVEYQTINGEDFKVWRWNPCASPEQNESGKQGKVWQGQAFSSLGKSKNSYTPTPCLKIRNMFDPDVECGDQWQVSIRDAILEKCEGNDKIQHIAFDAATNNEGCVYMMCSTEEAAGKAYNDLHGWWFDGKLVTVKYLKKGRYLQRFPEAEHSTEPLKPSNNKRLSLSTPFFSSALERS